MGKRTAEEWKALGKKRILNILKVYRVSYSRHLEIKISEAGPGNQRVEPALLNMALREMKKDAQILVVGNTSSMEIVAKPDFGLPGDKAKLNKLLRLHKVFIDYTSKNEQYCGLHLEKLLFDTVLELDSIYNVFGSGPVLNENGNLTKPSGSEIIHYNGKTSYKEAGLDLFIQHKKSLIPIGIEAKNIREWIYPAAYESWRMIAKACLLECQPVLAARKFSYITRAGFFSKMGILGFQTQFQYFNPKVRKDSDYKFQEVIDTKGLGFADIKITNDVPDYFIEFFQKTLPENLETYYDRFMKYRGVLKKYAIDYGLAEDTDNKTRFKIYKAFQKEAGFDDPDF